MGTWMRILGVPLRSFTSGSAPLPGVAWKLQGMGAEGCRKGKRGQKDQKNQKEIVSDVKSWVVCDCCVSWVHPSCSSIWILHPPLHPHLEVLEPPLPTSLDQGFVLRELLMP